MWSLRSLNAFAKHHTFMICDDLCFCYEWYSHQPTDVRHCKRWPLTEQVPFSLRISPSFLSLSLSPALPSENLNTTKWAFEEKLRQPTSESFQFDEQLVKFHSLRHQWVAITACSPCSRAQHFMHILQRCIQNMQTCVCFSTVVCERACESVPLVLCNDCNVNFRIIHRISVNIPQGIQK